MHRIHFTGRKGEEGGGTVTLCIRAEGITTEEMDSSLETLAAETMEKVKKVVAEQEAPQQIFW